MAKVIGICVGAAVLLFFGFFSLMDQTMQSRLSGDDVLNMVFNRKWPDFSLGEVRGAGNSVFQEGLIFANARFRSDSQPAFDHPDSWHELTSKEDREKTLSYLRGIFPEDSASLQNGPDVSVFRQDADSKFDFAYNSKTKIGAVGYGSGSNFADVVKQLNALNRYPSPTAGNSLDPNNHQINSTQSLNNGRDSASSKDAAGTKTDCMGLKYTPIESLNKYSTGGTADSGTEDKIKK
jgi:hypothetical protein